MKHRKLFWSILFLMSLLTACGLQKSDSNPSNDHTNSTPTSKPTSNGIANFGIEASLELKEDLSGLVFIFKLKNQSEQVQDLIFPSSLKYDYLVRDENNSIVKQRSKEMVGADQVSVVKLKQGEELVYKEDFNKVTKDLKKGNYTIEFISTAKKQDIRASLSFKVE
ncbi:BsuPI-related putative proteinase inhibitor [Neobacillus cucumis]|uniref:BsuPI-related putative proteinase inhibitor n=1 Tax=Neobacillus cucumis TaxID=1740721 RepID=UPI001964AE16|nr:BsuPI-related putative proteinase inhibitor [Neobacillus cucumis]MBM7652564.1 NhaP-type Na+/H+ and K+/H+ antiporter [Neobacillus cucumis]